MKQAKTFAVDYNITTYISGSQTFIIWAALETSRPPPPE
jgi:hypothetical protein